MFAIQGFIDTVCIGAAMWALEGYPQDIIVTVTPTATWYGETKIINIHPGKIIDLGHLGS